MNRYAVDGTGYENISSEQRITWSPGCKKNQKIINVTEDVRTYTGRDRLPLCSWPGLWTLSEIQSEESAKVNTVQEKLRERLGAAVVLRQQNWEQRRRHLGKLDHFNGLPGVSVLAFALQGISVNTVSHASCCLLVPIKQHLFELPEN